MHEFRAKSIPADKRCANCGCCKPKAERLPTDTVCFYDGAGPAEDYQSPVLLQDWDDVAGPAAAITNMMEYDAAMARLEVLMLQRPPPDSPAAAELEQLAAVIDEYERSVLQEVK